MQRNVQISLSDIYTDVAASLEEDKPLFFRLMNEHIDGDSIIPDSFRAFHKRMG